VRVRIACGVFNLCLGVVLLSFGRWEGVLALAGSALIFRTVFLLRRSVHG
jgi:urea transporter